MIGQLVSAAADTGLPLVHITAQISISASRPHWKSFKPVKKGRKDLWCRPVAFSFFILADLLLIPPKFLFCFSNRYKPVKLRALISFLWATKLSVCVHVEKWEPPLVRADFCTSAWAVDIIPCYAPASKCQNLWCKWEKICRDIISGSAIKSFIYDYHATATLRILSLNLSSLTYSPFRLNVSVKN